MELNFEKKYAYAEVYDILNWLGEEYKKKVPKDMMRLFKNERKFGYRPEIDYTKPLDSQVKQETKNIISFLESRYFIKDKERIKNVEDAINQRYLELKAKKKAERAQSRAGMNVPLNTAIDRAIKNLKN